MARHAPHHAHSHGSAQHDATSSAERAATWLSLACAVHCLVMPVALSVLPLLGASGFTDLSPNTELAMNVLVVLSSLAGLVWGYRRHGDLRIVSATLLGLLAYLVGHTLEPHWYGVTLAIAGALTLATSSFIGARLSHSCEHDNCTHPACAH